jgi:glyoxalase family protein
MPHRGIHHVTIIAGSAPRNLEFYTRVLGLRLVKKTVNFDDPHTYHFYYGDEAGQPGTIVTFFPWEGAEPGRLGVGETQEIVFRIPEASLGFWTQRLIEKGVTHDALVKRFGESVLSFKDPDGTRLAFAALRGVESEPGWSAEEIPAAHAIRGLHGVSLLLDRAEATAAVLTDILGFAAGPSEGTTRRYRVADATVGAVVDLREVGGFPRGRHGAGSVHHVAFRADNDADQTEMARKLVDGHHLRATEQKDRKYFRSIYFREPGGVLFEIATDPPGFAVDEPAQRLGQTLMLPAFLEGDRRDIEAALPKLDGAPPDVSFPAAALSFRHVFEPAAGASPPVLLLHGTGGDEHDLLPLGRTIAPGSSLLAPRGQVLENGMPRFFRRFSEGVFDEDDLRRQAEALADFIGEARQAYGVNAPPIAVGFSNGANIAAAILLLHPDALAGAVLIRPITPLVVEAGEGLKGKPILILSGSADQIAPPERAAQLADILVDRGADVRHETIAAGHGISPRDIKLSAAFFETLRSARVT